MRPSVPLSLLVGGLLLSFVFGMGVAPVAAQPSGLDCASRSETNATLILPDDVRLTVNEERLAPPVEIVVFTTDDQCMGRATWTGRPASLTVWGRRPSSPGPSPPSLLAPGDSMTFAVYNRTTNTEYRPPKSRISVSFRSDKPYLTTVSRYVPDGIYVVDRIRVQPALVTRTP